MAIEMLEDYAAECAAAIVDGADSDAAGVMDAAETRALAREVREHGQDPWWSGYAELPAGLSATEAEYQDALADAIDEIASGR